MTITRYKLLAYRANRPRSLDECTGDVSVLLNRLAKISPAIFRWKLLGSSKRKAIQNSFIDTNNLEFLSGLLLKNANRRDGDRSIIPDLGFRIFFWNGSSKDDIAASISIANGITSKVATNFVVLEFPYSDELKKNVEATIELLSAAADAIDAERALLFREDLAPISFDEMFLETAAFLADGFDPQTAHRLMQEADQKISANNGKIFIKR
ncbi:Imm52 family immunity protein [Rhizobium leguminosarum]